MNSNPKREKYIRQIGEIAYYFNNSDLPPFI